MVGDSDWTVVLERGWGVVRGISRSVRRVLIAGYGVLRAVVRGGIVRGCILAAIVRSGRLWAIVRYRVHELASVSRVDNLDVVDLMPRSWKWVMPRWFPSAWSFETPGHFRLSLLDI